MGSESKILSLVQAQSQTSEALSERLVKMEGLVEKQESRNQNLLYAVLFALVFIVITVAVEVILSTGREDRSMATFYAEIQDVKDEQVSRNRDVDDNIFLLQNQFDILKARNPYLK